MKYLFILSMIVGCASMPGGVTSYESKTDGIKHVQAEPGWLTDSAKLGISYISSAPDVYILEAAVKGATASTKDGLVIKIDNKLITLSAIDDLSDRDQYGFFHKRFMVKKEVVNQMVAGKSVYVKVNHTGQTYEEGEFSKDQPMSAKRGFMKFLETVRMPASETDSKR